MARSTCMLVLTAALVPSVARADDRSSWPFARLSLVKGDRDEGSVETKRDGFALALGLDHHTFSLYAELQLALQRSDSVRGLAADLAVHARRSIHSIDFGGAEVGCWLDLGVGVQSFSTRDTSSRRPAFSFGLGGGGMFHENHKVDGLELELRIEAAPAAGPSTLARCLGACAPASGSDFGAIVLASYPFSL